MGTVDLAGLRAELIDRGWTDHAVEDADEDFVFMLYKAEPDHINWPTIFVADNGYVSFGWEALDLDGVAVRSEPGFRLHRGSELWDVIDLVRRYVGG
jgi:hypothetical protein